MTVAATPSGPTPIAPDPGDEDLDAIRKVIEVEAVKAESGDLDDAVAALAVLLLDGLAARRDQGEIPTQSGATTCPDARRRTAGVPTPAGGEAA